MTNIPSIKEELTRKILETTDVATDRLEKGEISKRDYVTTLNTINSVALGLYDNDVAVVISSLLADNADSKPFLRREVFISFSNMTIYIAEYEEGSCKVKVVKIKNHEVRVNGSKDFSNEVTGQIKALAYFEDTVATLDAALDRP